jgi:hypothetical protein
VTGDLVLFRVKNNKKHDAIRCYTSVVDICFLFDLSDPFPTKKPLNFRFLIFLKKTEIISSNLLFELVHQFRRITTLNALNTPHSLII